jgi:hypothetical protein
MARRPTWKEIAAQDSHLLKRQQDFRVAADAVAAALGTFPEVERIDLFGSVARPLVREVPRFSDYRRYGTEVWHECNDVDLAVWLRDCSRLGDLNRARNASVTTLLADTGIGVASHQVDVFVLAAEDVRYLGRLCIFGACRKEKAECRIEGCGATRFLRQHEAFTFHGDALAPGRVISSFDRSTDLKPPGGV